MKPSYPSNTIIDIDQDASHTIKWWSIKVVCGALLIASLFLMVIYQIPALFVFPTLAAQIMVVAGGAVSVWHYSLLRRRNANIANPEVLLDQTAFYNWIRHPMYAADLLSYTGLFLLLPNWVTAFILAIAWVALLRQAQAEDAYLARRFGVEFRLWRARTKLLIPFVY